MPANPFRCAVHTLVYYRRQGNLCQNIMAGDVRAGGLTGGVKPTSRDAEIVTPWGSKPVGSVTRRRNYHRTRTVAWDIVNQ